MITASWFFLALTWFSLADAEGFTFPTDSDDQFIVDDIVVVAWDVGTPRLSLYEDCGEVASLDQPVSSQSELVT
jgi:hypothetical protein